MTGIEQENQALSVALERQQRLFQQSPSFLAVLRGPEHIFEFANDAYQRLLGGRTLIGRRVREAIPEAEPQGFLRILDSVYRTGRTYRGRDQRFNLVDPATGKTHTVTLTFQYKALRELNGQISGIYAEGSDVTERAEDEAALDFIRRETERRWAELESVYESAPVGLALFGAERFEHRRLNRVQAEIIGLPPEEVIGKTLREVYPDVADSAEALFREVAAGKQVRDVELSGELPQRPGEKRSWIVSYAPIWVEGRVESIICTALETTELRNAERVALQNEKLAAVGRLAASIAHEINNPLEAVTNLLFLAKNSDSLESSREYLEIAESELRRVSAITTQTLRFHRQASEPRAVACDDLLGTALAIYQGRLTSAGIPVRKRKRAQLPVICFDGEIRQVLNNLIGNATDALTTYGGTLFLRSREGTDPRTGRAGLWLTVADTGIGMSPETLRRAFEPFFTTKGIGGTGLGLWISREIITRHHGRLLVKSSQHPGHHGTVMSLFLPFDATRR
jgi:PAS domain S-box-containing protein